MTNPAAPTPTAEPVRRPLGVLESSGLIRLAATRPELEYLFRHVLVQDAAYDSLLKQERRRLHAAVAEAIEELHPESRDEVAGMLAWHYDSAGETERALACYIQAGQQAIRRYANDEAYSLFGRAAELLPAGDDPARLRQRIAITTGRVQAGVVSHPASEMVPLAESAIAPAEALGDARELGRAHLWVVVTRWLKGDLYEEGTAFRRSLDLALQIADETTDRELRGAALTLLGRSSLLSRDPARAAEVLEEAVELTRGGDLIGASMAANTLASAYALIGDFGRADQAITRAVELAQRSGDPVAIMDAGIASSTVEAERGNLAQSVAMARSSADQAAALGAPACAVMSNLIAGIGELRLGRVDLAVPPLTLSSDLAESNALYALGNMANAALSAATCLRGDIAGARAGWETALGRAREMHDPGMEAGILHQRAIAQEYGGTADAATVLADLEASLRLYEQIGARPRVASVLGDSARSLDALGRTAEAADRRRRADDLRADMGLAPAAGTDPHGSQV